MSEEGQWQDPVVAELLLIHLQLILDAEPHAPELFTGFAGHRDDPARPFDVKSADQA
jgi:hypothetical protein